MTMDRVGYNRGRRWMVDMGKDFRKVVVETEVIKEKCEYKGIPGEIGVMKRVRTS